MAARKKRPFRRIHDSATLPPLPTDMLDEIAALGRRNDKGMTLAELCTATGLSDRAVYKRIVLAQKAGRLVVGRRSGSTVDGRGKLSPVYTILPAAR